VNGFEGEIRKLIVNYGQQITKYSPITFVSFLITDRRYYLFVHYCSDLYKEKRQLLAEIVSPDAEEEANNAINQILTAKIIDVFNEEFERLFMSLRTSV